MSKTTAWLFIHSHGEGGSEAISSNNLKPTALTLSMTLFLSVIVSISYALELSLSQWKWKCDGCWGVSCMMFSKKMLSSTDDRPVTPDRRPLSCERIKVSTLLSRSTVLIYSSYTALQWLEQGSSQYLIFTLHAIAPWARFCQGDKVVIEDLLMLKMLLYWDATVKALFNCGPSWYDASLFFLLAVPHWWCWCDSVSL